MFGPTFASPPAPPAQMPEIALEYVVLPLVVSSPRYVPPGKAMVVRTESMLAWVQLFVPPDGGSCTATTAPAATVRLPATALPKPGKEPVLAALRTPALTVVPPAYALFVLPSTTVPLPNATRGPLPLMPAEGEMVTVSLWLKASTAPLPMLMLPLARASPLPPLPIWSVPLLTMVAPM